MKKKKNIEGGRIRAAYTGKESGLTDQHYIYSARISGLIDFRDKGTNKIDGRGCRATCEVVRQAKKIHRADDKCP